VRSCAESFAANGFRWSWLQLPVGPGAVSERCCESRKTPWCRPCDDTAAGRRVLPGARSASRSSTTSTAAGRTDPPAEAERGCWGNPVDPRRHDWCRSTTLVYNILFFISCYMFLYFIWWTPLNDSLGLLAAVWLQAKVCAYRWLELPHRLCPGSVCDDSAAETA